MSLVCYFHFSWHLCYVTPHVHEMQEPIKLCFVNSEPNWIHPMFIKLSIAASLWDYAINHGSCFWRCGHFWHLGGEGSNPLICFSFSVYSEHVKGSKRWHNSFSSLRRSDATCFLHLRRQFDFSRGGHIKMILLLNFLSECHSLWKTQTMGRLLGSLQFLVVDTTSSHQAPVIQ